MGAPLAQEKREGAGGGEGKEGDGKEGKCEGVTGREKEAGDYREPILNAIGLVFILVAFVSGGLINETYTLSWIFGGVSTFS